MQDSPTETIQLTPTSASPSRFSFAFPEETRRCNSLTDRSDLDVDRISIAPEVDEKYAKTFESCLFKLCHARNPSLGVAPKVIEQLENLLLHILLKIITNTKPQISDIEKYILDKFPVHLADMLVKEAKDAVKVYTGSTLSRKLARSTSTKLFLLPTLQKVQKIVKGHTNQKCDERTAIYLIGIAENIANDILGMTGRYVQSSQLEQITLLEFRAVLAADPLLMELLDQSHTDKTDVNIFRNLKFLSDSNAEEDSPRLTNLEKLTYSQITKELVSLENQHLRLLNILISLFKRLFEEVFGKNSETVKSIFSNINDLYNITIRFSRALEDTVEMSDNLMLGNVFYQELCGEGEELSCYNVYVETILNNELNELLASAIQNSKLLKRIENRGPQFEMILKYVLPQFLLAPLLHCLEYEDFIRALLVRTVNSDDQEDLLECLNVATRVRVRLESSLTVETIQNFKQMKLIPHVSPLLVSVRKPTPMHHLQHMRMVQKNIENWEGKYPLIGQTCTEFVKEGNLGKVRVGMENCIHESTKLKQRIFTERIAILFDNLLVLCKAKTNFTSSQSENVPRKYKLKERLQMRKIDVIDLEDTSELKNAFLVRDHSTQSENLQFSTQPIILFTSSKQDKCDWLAALIWLQNRNHMDRMLDSFLRDEEKRIPLLLPNPTQYRFAEPDTDDNIRFEDYCSASGSAVVKAATLVKLVERLTHHEYVDNRYMRTFLTTFRSFCKPIDLMNLLIERFDIPTPTELIMQGCTTPGPRYCRDGSSSTIDQFPRTSIDISMCDSASTGDAVMQYQRFKKEYMNQVQVRVISVLRRWLTHHSYDFENNEELLTKAREFITGVRGNLMRKWLQPLIKALEKIDENRKRSVTEVSQIRRRLQVESFANVPDIQWFTAKPGNIAKYSLLSLHPVELARQITLLESQLYSCVRPIELVESAWTKSDKDSRSPQLMKLIHHSNTITYYLEREMVETRNFTERVAMMDRMIEIMIVFEELNNFNGIMEFFSALNSSCLYRMEHTKGALSIEKREAYQHFKDLIGDGHQQAYKRALKACNPPVVPFVGQYLNTLFFLESRKTYFAETELDPNTIDDYDFYTTSKQEPMILFNKCRKISDTIAEIQMYQDNPYVLMEEPTIREFLEKLNPMQGLEKGNMDALEKYLYDQSVLIEPKNVDRPPTFPTRFDPACLKSPGIRIKPKAVRENVEKRVYKRNISANTLQSKDEIDSCNITPTTPRSPMVLPENFINHNSNINNDDDEMDFAVIDLRPGQNPIHVEDVKVPKNNAPQLFPRQISPRHSTVIPPPRPVKTHPPKLPITPTTLLSKPKGQDVFQFPTISKSAPSPIFRPSGNLPMPLSPNTVERMIASPPVLYPRKATFQPDNSAPPRPPRTDLQLNANTHLPDDGPPLPPRTYLFNKKYIQQ